MRKLLFPFAVLLHTLSFSQAKIDSLQLEYKKAIVDSIKIKILHQLYSEYQYDFPGKGKESVLKAILLSKQIGNVRFEAISYNIYGDFFSSRSNYDSAIVQYSAGLRLSKKVQYNDGIFEGLVGLGNVHWKKGDFKKAKEFHKKSFELAKIRNDQEDIVHYYNNMANIYVETGEYTKAMELYTKASKKHLENGNIKDYGITLGNIALVQRRLENYESAIDYLILSDSIFKETNFLPGKAYVEYSLAVVYKNKGNIEEALKYNRKAIESYQSLGNRKRLAYAQYTMGSIHWEQKEFSKALSFYQTALITSSDIKDSVNIGYSLKAIGDSYHKLKDTNNALAYLFDALEVAKDVELNLVELDVYESLSNIYIEESNYEQAYIYKNLYSVVRDSFHSVEKRELANEIEAKFQNEQKTKEIALLESEKNLQTLQLNKRINERNTIIAFSLVMLTLAVLLYKQYRIKQRTNEKLRELDRLKSNFFANISHEFRTPLALIKGPIERLEQNLDENLSKDNVRMIRRNTNRVLQLVNQLLDLSKIDEGNLKLEPTEGDIYKCLRAATSSFSSHAAQRNIDYKVQIPQTKLWASFDRDKFEKIVYNLLGNAFKFSENGSIISIETQYTGDDLKIVVSDSGKGIPKEKLPFVFDRFYQVDGGSTKEKEGSGIGLSISKELVELMDGTITVSSEINEGSIFTAQIPLQEIKTGQVKTEKLISSSKPKVDISKPYDLKGTDKRTLPSILLIEDNDDMRHYIKEQLIKFYKIKEAINGIIGLQMAISNPPELIITDLMMPKMDGIELCKKLKTNVHTSHVPIIMLTAKAGIDNKIEGLETGADDYLTKPFDGKELLVRTKNLIEQRQKLRELFTNKEILVNPRKITVTSTDTKFLEQVLALLEAEFSDSDFGVTQMQETLAMSKTQLHRKLKALTNEAPGELLRNFRLKRAAQLLSQKADNVTQIAYRVGFNNLSYFAKCFKELYGVAPSSY